MPELPDVTVYVEAIAARTMGEPISAVRLGSPFLVRTVDPPVNAVAGRRVTHARRIGKRIAIGVDSGDWLVIHLMIAGRLHWSERRPKVDGRRNLMSIDFAAGSLWLTEAGAKKRASVHMAGGEAALLALDPGGLELADATPERFAAALRAENHTLKRALTDPRTFSGIGNAYSDEILHRARLSPIAHTHKLTAEEIERLRLGTIESMSEWTARLREQAGGRFPEGVTAFREEMAVHGRFGKPCPRCGDPVQRIRYAANETNYCPRCQTGGALLADRALSRLLGKDWPRSLEELEALKRR